MTRHGILLRALRLFAANLIILLLHELSNLLRPASTSLLHKEYRSMVRSPSVAVVIVLAAMTAGLFARPAVAEEGQWSRLAVAVPSQRNFVIPSPDRKKTIRIEGFDLTVAEGGLPVPGGVNISILKPAEIAWAPDSKAFTVTSSDGGADGTWEVVVFLLEYERFTYYDPGKEAVLLFKQQYPCLDQLEPNVGAVRWLKESKHLLLALEMPPAAACADRKAVRGYAVEANTGKVLKEYERRKLIDEWGEYLGKRLVPDLAR
jgi:hypothetical protein